jgi:hypothetical protein
MRVERIDVVLNTKAHDLTLLVRSGLQGTRRLPVASIKVIGPADENLRRFSSKTTKARPRPGFRGTALDVPGGAGREISP